MNLAQRLWQEEDGVLSFEWVLLVTLVVIGIVGGLAAARDGIIDELGDVAQAAIALDQSYLLEGLVITNTDMTISVTLTESEFIDSAPLFEDCDRAGAPFGQGPEFDPG